MTRGLVSRSQFLAGAALFAGSSAATSAQTLSIRFGAAGAESFDESFYLIDQRFLRQAGMDGAVQILPNGPTIMDAVLGGSMDVGMSDILQVANAVRRGLPLAFFAGGCLYDTAAPTTRLCVAKASPLRTAKDLEGKTISLQGLKTLAEISTREWLRRNGADPEGVNFLELGPAVAVPSLVRGTVDAAIVSEPFFAAGGDQVRAFGKPYDAVANRFYISSWYAKQDWLSANASNAVKLQRAIYESGRWAQTHRDESGQILLKRLRLDAALIGRMTRATFAPALDPKLMQPVLNIALKYGLLEQPVNATTLIAHT
jgi:NitT/TauT family transport system substrate-binding protein